MSDPKQTALDYLNNWRDAQTKIAELEDELGRFRNGYKGGCYACETVGEKNLKLEAALAELRREVVALNEELAIERGLDKLEKDYE